MAALRLGLGVALASIVIAASAANARAAVDPTLATAAPVQSRILVWGTGSFVGRDAFDAWLRLHHEEYKAWAAAHPVARAVLARSTVPFGFRPSQLAPTKGPWQPRAVAPPTSVSAPRRGLGLDVLLLLVGASIAAAAIALPMRQTNGSAFVVSFAERRLAIFTAGTAILIGVAIAKLMS